MGGELMEVALTVLSTQHGVAAGAGSITINAVNVNKAVVISRSKGSAGTVAATGSISLSPSGPGPASSGTVSPCPWNSTAGTESYSGSISGGTTNLTVKEYSAVLTNSTTITVDGPCEWQVINFV
jgi:hypothetical protein